ncbi:MAG: hypothetical protein PVF83_10265 [Anaerolineales bacterium]|jgi:hypothetical protein
MSEPMRLSAMEIAVKDALSVPEPDAGFIDSLRARFVAGSHASLIDHQEVQMKKKALSKRFAWALLALVIVALGILFTNPTVANALKRLFGYVPDVGIVDQSTQVWVLEEPVTVIREKFILVVEQAVLSSEKTVILYSYSTPADYVHNPDPADTFNEKTPFLTLPDGTRLDVIIGWQVSTENCPQCSIRDALEFPPVTSGVEELTLELPSLAAMPRGAAPEDWSIPLKFRPATESDFLPVIEYIETPAPTQLASETPAQIPYTYGITLALDKIADLPDGYVLYGSITWADPVIQQYGIMEMITGIKDADGVEIPFEYIAPEKYAQPGELRVYWAYKVSKDFTPPLNLSFVMTASLPADGGSFSFDPGDNPLLGQKWDINQDVTVNGQVIHVLTAEQSGSEPGYLQFTMQSDSNIVGAIVMDLAHPPQGGGGGGGGLPETTFMTGFNYQTPLPPGPLTLTFIEIMVYVPGDWTLTWSP